MTMTMYKANSLGRAVCGAAGQTTIYWHGVTCGPCLDLKPADAGERRSIKRSHRAEGNNFVD